ncbi:hypothetical protein LZ31DRAFT_35739 [Colletotrichum somersetense]|nr:hypothetical protein LZ31DRAFT_35739 [Colletotrichum somersetense]
MVPACSFALIHNQLAWLRRDSSPQSRHHHQPASPSSKVARMLPALASLKASPSRTAMQRCGGLGYCPFLRAPTGAHNQSTYHEPPETVPLKARYTPETRGHLSPALVLARPRVGHVACNSEPGAGGFSCGGEAQRKPCRQPEPARARDPSIRASSDVSAVRLDSCSTRRGWLRPYITGTKVVARAPPPPPPSPRSTPDGYRHADVGLEGCGPRARCLPLVKSPENLGRPRRSGSRPPRTLKLRGSLAVARVGV